MGKYNFSQLYFWYDIQNYFLKRVISLRIKLISSLVQTLSTIAFEIFYHPDDQITQILATQNDCSKQYNLRHYSLKRVQKCTQAPFEIE